jgi:DMSO/TMAO reductase YedYZ molybdopterin-dependent catalytic subunit
VGRYSARIAAEGEGISTDELRLAARNHGMPAEALRYNVTPVGLHYVLTHYDIPDVSVGAWRLNVGGAVDNPLELDLFELQGEKSRTIRVTMECAGNGRARLSPRPVSQPWLVDAVGTADWTGVPLSALLNAAGVRPDAVEVVFTGADHGWERGVEQDYQRSLPLAEARAYDVLVAYLMNGQPLPVQHGAPARLVVPGWYGMTNVKWLRSIDVVTEPFTGFQNAEAYRLRHEAGDEGVPVSRIEPRAALIPPGVPDFMTRDRFVKAGAVSLSGKAWSGWGEITRVEVSTDGGATWIDATVESPSGPDVHAWQRFDAVWQATPGEHELLARATDATGRRQPVEGPWNRGGFANNSSERLVVTVV